MQEFTTKNGLTVKYQKFTGLEQINIFVELKKHLVPALNSKEMQKYQGNNMWKTIISVLLLDEFLITKAIKLLMGHPHKPITILGEDGNEIPYLELDDMSDYFQILWELFKINFTKSCNAVGLDLSALEKTMTEKDTSPQ